MFLTIHWRPPGIISPLSVDAQQDQQCRGEIELSLNAMTPTKKAKNQTS